MPRTTLRPHTVDSNDVESICARVCHTRKAELYWCDGVRLSSSVRVFELVLCHWNDAYGHAETLVVGTAYGDSTVLTLYTEGSRRWMLAAIVENWTAIRDEVRAQKYTFDLTSIIPLLHYGIELEDDYDDSD